MQKFIVSEAVNLNGKVKIESAKNAVLPMLAGAILTDKKVTIIDCPKIKDVLSMISILRSIGVRVTFEENNLIIDSSSISKYSIDQELTKELRSSVYMLGALISRCKKAVIASPGGCKIGTRPIDIHVDGLKKLGVKFNDDLALNCSVDKVLANTLEMRFPSVGATVNLILASVLCDGVTVIKNYAKEPEIFDFVNFLNSMGAKISFSRNSVFVKGVKYLHGTEYKPMSDRIESATYFTALQMTGGELEFINANAKNIVRLCDKFSNNTCKIVLNNDIIHISCRRGSAPINICTAPYPGFPTDLQPQFMVYDTVADGNSVVVEKVFENRFLHVPELIKMGANVKVKDRTAIIKGVKKLRGATVVAPDLRGGASLILAGLVAEGETVVLDVGHIERGYLDFDKKLASIGVNIRRET